jgi:hypothetical protein
MAWGSVGTLGTGLNTGNNHSSIVLTTTATLEAGNVGVIIIATQNNQTTDGDEGAVSGVVDSAGNTWSKAAEFTNGQGTIQTGSVCSVWYVKAGAQLTSGGTITASLTNNSSRDESCCTAWEFTVGAGNFVGVAGTATLANDAADPGSLDVTTATSGEYLRIRGTSSELNSVTNWTATDGNWTVFSVTRSANVAAAQSVRGEHRIVSGTNSASNPTLASADHASVYVALEELVPVSISPAEGPATLSGLVPSLALALGIGAGALGLAGPEPTVTVPQPVVATPDAGAMTLAGQAPVGVVGSTVSPAQGALALTGQAPTALVVTALPLLDDFGDSSQDEGKWSKRAADQSSTDPLVTVVETTVLTITPRASVSGFHYNGYTSVAVFDLTGASVTVEVPTVPTISSVGPFCGLQVNFSDSDSSKLASISAAEGSQLYLQFNAGIASVAYNATNHRWWRIRHAVADDTIRLETSPDGLAWTQQSSNARTDAITQTRATIQAGTYSSAGSPGTAVFDNFDAHVDWRFEPSAGALTLAGQTPTLDFAYSVGVGTLTLAGLAPTVTEGAQGITIEVPTGTLLIRGPGVRPSDLTLTGHAPTISVGGGTTLSPDVGTLALVGQSISLALGQTPDAGALTISGQAPQINVGSNISPAEAALTLAGQTPTRIEALSFSPAAADLVLAGQTPALNTSVRADVDAAVLTLSGQAPIASVNFITPVAAGTLTVSGQASVLLDNGVLVPAGALSLAGTASSLDAGIGVPAGVLTLGGQTPSLTGANTYSPDAGALTLTGQAPTLQFFYVVFPDAGILTLAGHAPTAPQTQLISVDAGSLALAGQAPSLRYDLAASPDQGALTLAGQAPQAAVPIVVPAGALTLSGQTPTSQQTLLASPGVGSLTLAGQSPDLRFFYVVFPDQASLTLSGQAPVVDRSIAVPAGALTLTGQAPALSTGVGRAVDAGALSLAGQTPDARLALSISPDAGTLALAGTAPNIAYTTTPSAGALTLSGETPALNFFYVAAVDRGALTLSGQAPELQFGQLVVPNGDLVLAGQTPTIATAAIPIRIHAVGSYQSALSGIGSYQSTISGLGSYQSTIDALGSSGDV